MAKKKHLSSGSHHKRIFSDKAVPKQWIQPKYNLEMNRKHKKELGSSN